MSEQLPTTVTEPPSLPHYMQEENADFWLADKELNEIIQTHQVGPWAKLRSASWLLILYAFAVFFCYPGLLLIFLYIVIGTLIPAIGGMIAFRQVDDCKIAAAKRTTRIVRRLNSYFLPISASFCSLMIGQVEAIINSLEGKFVDSQLSLAECLTGLGEQYPIRNTALMTTMANIYARAGRFDLAEPLYQDRFNSANKWFARLASDEISRACAYNNLGWIFLLTGKYKQANDTLQEGIKLARITWFNRDDIRLTNLRMELDINLARTHIRLGDEDQAETMLARTFAEATTRYKHVESCLAEIQTGYAELRFIQKRFDEAKIHADSALEAYVAIGAKGNVYYRYVRHLQAEIYRALGQDGESARILLESEIEVDRIATENLQRLRQIRQVLKPQQLGG